MNVSIPFAEAVMGLTRSVRLPSNETITIHSTGFQGSINMDEVIVVKDKGIPIRQKGANGSLLVHVSTYYPLLLPHDERERVRNRLGEAFEEVMLYLEFVSTRELDRFNTEVGYDWTREELRWSCICQSRLCSPCIMNLALYYCACLFQETKE